MQAAVGMKETRSSFVAVKQGDAKDPVVLSYLGLRKAVGIIGLALPFVLVFGKMLLQGGGIEHSISDYYYTDVRSWFVGSLCAIGVFLLSTRGYDIRDAIAGRLAFVFAITVALLPTTPTSASVCPPAPPSYISYIHWASAALLFSTLAYFCFALFTETDPNKPRTSRKLVRNVFYRVCGTLILVSIFSIGVSKLLSHFNHPQPVTLVFWFESLAVIAFAVAWLIKGEAILKDKVI